MLQREPGDGRIVLTEHERHQLELIERGLADAEPSRAPAGATASGWRRRLLWLVLTTVAGSGMVMAVLAGIAWLAELGAVVFCVMFVTTLTVSFPHGPDTVR